MKRIMTFAAALTLTFGAFAQQQQQEKENPWFVSGQLGLGYTSGHGGLGELLSPSGAIAVGKYFSPAWGARLSVSGWRGRAAKARGGVSGFYYGAATADAMFNISQAFKRNSQRLFDVSLIAGVGFNRSYGPNESSFMGRAGLQGSFRICPVLDFNVEAMANGVSDRWNGLDDHGIDTYFDLGFGLTYKFGMGYKCPSCVSVEYNNDYLDCINKKINRLREEKVKTVTVRDTVRIGGPTEKVVRGIKSHVSFEISKTHIAPSQEMNVMAIADYMKQFPDAKAIVAGYADKGTGTPAINLRLAKERAQAVADMLAGKYGIERSRLTVQSMQGDEQPFQINDWNRVVIITAD